MDSHQEKPQFVRIAVRDRTAVIFTLDGVPTPALSGDTILTAILTHRSTLRPFEFGEGSRAGFCLMGACQDCWVTTSVGRVRACTTAVTHGLAVSTGPIDA